MDRSFCRQIKNNAGMCCGPAAFRVWWVQTGEDETLTCALHFAQAVRRYQNDHPGDTIKTRAI